MGRSGTTLIERILGALPGVCPAGEVVHLWERGLADGERCGCGKPFSDCPFWQAVGEEAFAGWDKLDHSAVARLRHRVDRTRFIPLLAAPRRPPEFQRALDEYASYYLRLYAAIAKVSGSVSVVDSSKHASLAFCLRTCSCIDLRVIHVVRDSRAVAYSWTRRVRRPDTASDSYMRTYTPVHAAGQWAAQNATIELLTRLGTPTLRVAYEELVRAPRQTMSPITEFIGLELGPQALGFLGNGPDGPWAELQPAHTASGNPLRFQTGRIPIQDDDAWRVAMPASARRTVSALTFPLLARYGYGHAAARPNQAAQEEDPNSGFRATR
jgi:hypothetical protein